MRLALDHVQIAIPADGEGAARRFFGELLGLTELPKPGELALRGGCWFAVGELQLHLGIDHDFRPATRAHVAFAAANLSKLRERLEAAHVPTHDDGALKGRERFFAEDPFGNRIEFIEYVQ